MSSTSRPSTAALGAAVAAIFVVAQPGWAAELSYGAFVGMGHTDNIARVAEDEQDENIATVGGQLRLDHESRRLDANIATRLEYRDYLDDTFDSEVVGNLIGNAVLDIIEERFTWTLEDTFGQSTLNQFAPATPANTENTNYLSTGPDFTLPLGSRNKLVLMGRYADVHYEESNLGNQRVRGELTLARELSEASILALNATSEEVTFDDELQFARFDRNEGYLSYDVEAARTTLHVDAGITEIRSGDQTDDSWLGRFDVRRQVSPALTAGLELGHDFSDAGNAFAHMQSQQPGSVEPVPVLQTALPFENTYGAVLAEFSRNRTDVSVRAGYYDEKYEGQPLFDRKRLTFDLNLHRDLSSVMTGYLGAYYSRQDYEALDREFADLTGVLGMRWNFGRAGFVDLEYRYLDRDDDAIGADYTANEIWLRLAYQVGEDAGSGSFSGF